MKRVGIFVFVLAMLVASAAAWAATETEPNNGPTTANGPLTAGTVYSGALANGSDEDWYMFYADVGTITVDASGLEGGWTEVDLLDADGDYLEGDFAPSNGDGTVHFTFDEADADSKYYIQVFEGPAAGDDYSFHISGQIHSGPGNPVPEPTPNGNGSKSSAFGPLERGTTYGGILSTAAEEDWFYFNTDDAGEVDIAIHNVGDASDSLTKVELIDSDDNTVDSLDEIDENVVDYVTVNAKADRTYYLRMHGDAAGDEYQVLINPNAPVTTDPIPNDPGDGDSAACKKAKSELADAKAAYKKAKKKVKRKHGDAKKKAKKKAKKAKKKVRKARRAVEAAC